MFVYYRMLLFFDTNALFRAADAASKDLPLPVPRGYVIGTAELGLTNKRY